MVQMSYYLLSKDRKHKKSQFFSDNTRRRCIILPNILVTESDRSPFICNNLGSDRPDLTTHEEDVHILLVQPPDTNSH